MFEGCFESFGYPLIAVAQAVFAAVLAVLSMAPQAVSAASHVRPGVAASGSPSSSTNVKTIGSLSMRVEREGTQRRTWVARLNLFELRVERDSSKGSAAWSLTILIHESGDEADSEPGAAREKYI